MSKGVDPIVSLGVAGRDLDLDLGVVGKRGGGVSMGCGWRRGCGQGVTPKRNEDRVVLALRRVVGGGIVVDRLLRLRWLPPRR
jgi:hypothetical protein